jgi:hypothetical protein
VDARLGLVPLGRDSTERESEQARGDDERPIGAHEGRANGLDRLQVRLGGLLHAGEVVVVREVDHPVRVGHAGAQAVGIVQAAAVDLGADRGERFGGSVRAGEAEDLMSGVEKLRDDGRADPSGCSGDEDAHVAPH